MRLNLYLMCSTSTDMAYSPLFKTSKEVLHILHGVDLTITNKHYIFIHDLLHRKLIHLRFTTYHTHSLTQASVE